MKAMILERLVSLDETTHPLSYVDWPDPVPADDELLLRVRACGVCHTELDEIEGRTAPPRLPIILGHEVVGRVESMGANVRGYTLGDRVGVGWIHRSSGQSDENLSEDFEATGRDVHGGYAELMTVPAKYAYPIPSAFSDVQAAPLLCAGGVGYRSLKLCALRDGQPIGLTGFGGSAHLVLQLSRFLYPQSPIYVFARNEDQRAFALELGATWAGPTEAQPPSAPRAIIDTTPAWTPIVAALGVLKPGGRLVINAIRKEDGDRDALDNLDYRDHLWMEKEIKSVANVTAADIAELLQLAARIPIRPEVERWPLKHANEALISLKHGSIRGAKVLEIG